MSDTVRFEMYLPIILSIQGNRGTLRKLILLLIVFSRLSVSILLQELNADTNFR